MEPKEQATTATENSAPAKTVPLSELEQFRKESQEQVEKLQEENRKILKAMEGYKAQAKAKAEKPDETAWEERVKSIETDYSQKLNTLKSRVFDVQRKASENELKAALSQAGAKDPDYLIYQAKNAGLIKEQETESGDLSIVLHDFSGKREIRTEKGFEPVRAEDLAKSMRESGKFDHLFLSDKPAGHGASTPGTARTQNQFQAAYEAELNGQKRPFVLTQIEQRAKKNGINLKT